MARSRASAVPALTHAAPLFAALGDDTRLKIVARLCSTGPQSIVRLTQGGDVSRQAVTKHLHALSKVGIVRSARDGRERIWEIQTKRLMEVRHYLERISEQWDDAIGRLRDLVEKE